MKKNLLLVAFLGLSSVFALNAHLMKTVSLLFVVFVVCILSAQISQAQWQPDVQLTNDPGASLTSDNNTQCVAADGDVVHVVWYDNRDGNTEIYYKRSTDGGVNWGADTRLTNNNANSWQPSIAVSGQFVHVIWYDYRSVDPEIYYKHSSNGGVSWGADTRLTNGSAESRFSSVTVSGQVVHVVWNSLDTTTLITNVFYKRSTDAGSTWGANVQLTNNNSGYMGYPSLSVSGQAVHVVVEDIRTSSYWNIYYVRSMDGGASWGAGTWLTNSIGHSWFPCVSASGLSVHVAFYSTRDGHNEIYYKRSTNGGVSWDADTRLTNNNYDSNWPSISASGSFVHVVWVSVGALKYKQSTDGGSSWGATTQLSYTYQYPSVTIFGSVVHVVWTMNAGNFEICYKRNPTGNVTGMKDIDLEIPKEFALSQNYPNPFNPSTRIHYALPRSSFVTMFVFNTLGQQVSQLVSEQQQAGYHEAVFRGEGLVSGVYFYRLQAGDYLATKKLVLLR